MRAYLTTRRDFIKQMSVGATALTIPTLLSFAKENSIPVRAITLGSKFHWFGYYDKLQFNSTNRYILGMQVDFEMRSPTKDDVIKVGYIDLEDNDKWYEIGESRSWGWQQGCMLQWIPGSKTKVVWNDRRGEDFISIVKDIETGEEKVIDKAIYAVSPDGISAVGTDFSRIQNYRKGYGYPGGVDKYKHENAPYKSGIYKINLQTGKSKLILSYNEISEVANNGLDISEKWHYFNHLLVSTNGERFIFLNRWRDEPIADDILMNPTEYNKIRGNYTTRMFTCGMDGENLYLLDPSGKTSHFIWKNPNHITAWTRPIGKENGFWEFKDKTTEIRQVGKDVMKVNGHNTYLPASNNEWILNDTYPQGPEREQIPYLFHEKTNKRIDLGRFNEPKEYKGEWRCDTHPRASNDGKMVCIDSTHGGNGRQMYLLDLSSLDI